MSTTGPETTVSPEAPTGPRATREEVRDLGRIRRTVGGERKVAGVAGGLARHLDIDPIILRVAFVVLVFFGGSGLLLYGAAWLLVPEDGAARAPLNLDDRSRSVALVVVGAIAALLLLGDSIGQFDFPWPLVVIGGIALVVLVFLDRDKGPRAAVPPPAPTATGGWVGPAPAYRPPPRNPRKRGPTLFWFTLLAAAVLVASLGVLDMAGVTVAPAAYPATVVATCGVMLLVGAFWGRAGGLILIGLLAAGTMAATAGASTVEGSDVRVTPTSAAAVDDDVSIDAGEIQLDLTDVADLAALDGRTLTQRVRAGRIEVIVPDGWGLRVDASVTGAGHVQLFDSERGGFDLSDTYGTGADPGLPTLTLDAQAFAGEIQIHHPGQELVQ